MISTEVGVLPNHGMVEEEQPTVQEWDINDPSLAGVNFEGDTEEVPVQLRPAPPPDGHYWAKFRLGNKKDGSPVYIKGIKGPGGQITEAKVVAILEGKIYDPETGQEGAFLKTWWPTTQIFKGSKGSQITAICFLAGKPVKSSKPGGPTLSEIKAHFEQLFAEAGEEGVLLFVKIRWIKSVPKFTEILDSEGNPTGLYGYAYKPGSTTDKEYEPEIKGEAKIKKLMALQGVPEERAHLWTDIVTGEERAVQAEVWSLEDPSKFNFGG